MKKIIFLLAMLAGVAASAQVTVVEPVGADYTSKTVSFRVRWNAGTRDATHLSKVWVWIDYITVNSNNTTSGNTWTRALVSGTPTATVGTASRETGNDKGFWLQGNAGSYSGTVTVKLNITAGKFNWCAYVSDYPPNARITTGTYKAGTYTLKGTKPFTVNGTVSVNANTYSGGSITSVTDATQCPGYRCGLRDEAPGTMGCCPGLTAVGGGTYTVSEGTYTTPAVCRDISADETMETICGVEIEKTIKGLDLWPVAYADCASKGWRLPSRFILRCIFEAGLWRQPVAVTHAECDRWIDQPYQRSGCTCGVPLYCGIDENSHTDTALWRCVR